MEFEQESYPTLFNNNYEFDPITIVITIRKHPKIKNYCENLSRKNTILILSSIYPEDEFENEVEELDKSQLDKSTLSDELAYVLSRHLDVQKDELIIDWCRETLNKIKDKKIKDIRPLDSLKDYKPVIIEPFNLSREDAMKLDKYNLKYRDRLGEFCCDHLCINGSYLDALESNKELNRYSLLKVIQRKVRIKKLIKEMDKFLRYNTFETEKKMLFELCSKFNLNIKIHTWDSKYSKEKLMREDNDGWFMTQKKNTINFEVGKYGNHFFPYYFIDINQDILKDPFKLIAFFQFADFYGFERFQTPSDNQKLSTMKLVINLIKLGFLTKHDIGKNNKILRYDGSKYFHENGEIKSSIVLRTGQAAIEIGLFETAVLTYKQSETETKID